MLVLPVVHPRTLAAGLGALALPALGLAPDPPPSAGVMDLIEALRSLTG